MNIKEIFKKNMLAVVAVATVIGFSAFKMAENNSFADNWYYADTNGDLQPYPGVPEGDCNTELEEGDECAVQTHSPVPANTPRQSLTPSQIKDQAFTDIP